jgi:hypothetical protein
MKRERHHVYSVKYGFNQPLPVPADEAFDWCTDYQPYDLAMMKEDGKRTIRKITDDTILLIETTRRNNRSIRKTKLVRLNRPELSWTNTHIAGPNRHSQFLYKIVPEGKTRSRLYFKGLLVWYSRKKLRGRQLLRIGREERLADSTAWRYLATALRGQAANS